MALILASSFPAEIDFERLAACMAMAESGTAEHPAGDDDAIGPHGERSRFQFQRQLWQQITPLDFDTWAKDYSTAKGIAIRRLKWLQGKLRGFKSLDHDQIYLIALAWHAGPQAVLHVFATGNQRDFAQRVANLYHEEKK